VQGGYGVSFAFHVQCLLVRVASRYKFYGSREIITGYKFGSGHWSSVAVQGISEPEIYHGARVSLRADARVRVQWELRIYLGAGAAKLMTSNLPLLTVLAFVFLFVSL
jgi:hypothetical protein